MLKILKNQTIPADMIVLKSDESTGTFYIKTDQLDGETDWKKRCASRFIQKFDYDCLYKVKSYCICESPSSDIHLFNGVLKVALYPNTGNERLTIENTAWKNSILISEYIVGMVIYTGKETKAQLSKQINRFKRGVVDKEINNINRICFFILILFSIGFLALKGFKNSFLDCFITFLKYFVLLNGIFPISLKVNIDGGKVIISVLISKSKRLLNVKVRNTSIPEELGRVEAILSDKTGTLTKNEMKFRKLYTRFGDFDSDNFESLKQILKNIINGESTLDYYTQQSYLQSIYSLLLCNTVNPVNHPEKGTKFYESSNADDLEFVKFCSDLGFEMISRNQSEINISNCIGDTEKFEILFEFPFKSELRRMGIILKNISTQKIYFYLKGSDSTILDMLVQEDKNISLLKSNEVADGGLRSLVVCYKELSIEKFGQFYNSLSNFLNSNFENNDEYLYQIRKSLEIDMNFISATGVEDSLQENVVETIEIFYNSGIKFWILTGDKFETALNIFKVCKLHRNLEIIEIIADSKTEIEVKIKSELERIRNSRINTFSLIIDGIVLEHLFQNEKEFFELSSKLISVVVCRCSPYQKFEITKKYKQYTKQIVMAVGDGGNDVSMIEESNIGIGIQGKEGNQACLASDISVGRFQDLKFLIFYLGRNHYKNAILLTLYVFHRGFLQSLMQMYFSFFCYGNDIMLFNPTMITLFTTLYTNISSFTYYLDMQVYAENEKSFPSKYREIQKGRAINTKVLLISLCQAIYQSFVIYIGCFLAFRKEYYELIASSFLCLCISEFIFLHGNCNRIHWGMLLALFISFSGFVITVSTFGPVVGIVKFKFVGYMKMLLIVFISLFPFILFRFRNNLIKALQKLMRFFRKKKIYKLIN